MLLELVSKCQAEKEESNQGKGPSTLRACRCQRASHSVQHREMLNVTGLSGQRVIGGGGETELE